MNSIYYTMNTKNCKKREWKTIHVREEIEGEFLPSQILSFTLYNLGGGY